MAMDANELKGFLRGGRLTALPSGRRRRLAALLWLSEYIEPDARYTQREFNALLERLHTFHDPATLRRGLVASGLVCREPDGSAYRLNPDRPSAAQLLGEARRAEEARAEAAADSGLDLAGAAEFRDRIHAEALRRVRQFRPDAACVVDRYSVYEYFQQVWDYPGAWYTIVAVPARAGSREALIDGIVRDTLAALR